MKRARVLVVDGDDWVARLLADGLRDHGFDVSTCLSGGDAVAVAATVEPDCVIVEMVLPEMDGPSVAKALRSEPDPLRHVPILFLSNLDDLSSRQMAFQAGADVYLSKPFRVDGVALQVRGLVAMANRLTGSAKAPVVVEEGTSSENTIPTEHAIEGDIAQMSVATVLTLLEMERRSGLLEVSSGSRLCVLEITVGHAVGGMVDGSKQSPLDVLRHILRWTDGRFRFTPGQDTAIPSTRGSIGALLLEAVRLDDEAARDGWAEENPTGRRSWPAPLTGTKRASVSSRKSVRPVAVKTVPRPLAGAAPLTTGRKIQPPPPPVLRKKS